MDTFTLIACIVVLCFGIFAGRITTVNMFIVMLTASLSFLCGSFLVKLFARISGKSNK